MNNSKEFEIEFSFLGQRLKVKLKAANESDVLAELAKSLMAKTQIHSISETKNYDKRGF